VWYVRNSKVGDTQEHKFEIDIESEGKAEEVCIDQTLFTVDCCCKSIFFRNAAKMLATGMDLGFHKGGCPIHLKGTPDVKCKRC